MNLHQMRIDFLTPHLNKNQLAADPFEQFGNWFQDAINEYNDEANAMTLATASADGVPSARMVLLKEYNERGFVFFTNYESPKSQQLLENPQAALLFYWPSLHRQVRVVGQVERVEEEQSKEYFQSRPWESQVGAWSSPQSQVIHGREELLAKVALNAGRFVGRKKLPLPPFWGGFIVKPSVFEFWQGQPSRLHDRFKYSPTGKTSWEIERLAP